VEEEHSWQRDQYIFSSRIKQSKEGQVAEQGERGRRKRSGEEGRVESAVLGSDS
jgi:hypothetical protein